MKNLPQQDQCRSLTPRPEKNMSKFARLLNTARSTDRYWFSRVKYDAAAQLQDLLKGAGLTQDKYAEKLGVKAPQVSRALSGSWNPTLETLVKMGWALGYVPEVKFVPVTAQPASATKATAASSLNLEIAITRSALAAGQFRFDVPIGPRTSGWTLTNDE